MRNMAFSITTQQMYEQTKTVTRHLGWSFLKPGDIVMAVEKGMGLKKGEKVKQIYPIEIVSIRGESLSSITIEDIAREGFPQMNVPQFVRMFAKSHGCNVHTMVNRIEFKPLAQPNGARAPQRTAEWVCQNCNKRHPVEVDFCDSCGDGRR